MTRTRTAQIPANQLNPACQNVSGKVFVTSIAMTSTWDS
jgi:hypothetical protein